MVRRSTTSHTRMPVPLTMPLCVSRTKQASSTGLYVPATFGSLRERQFVRPKTRTPVKLLTTVKSLQEQAENMRWLYKQLGYRTYSGCSMPGHPTIHQPQ